VTTTYIREIKIEEDAGERRVDLFVYDEVATLARPRPPRARVPSGREISLSPHSTHGSEAAAQPHAFPFGPVHVGADVTSAASVELNLCNSRARTPVRGAGRSTPNGTHIHALLVT
jgi:hypothetical protein